MLVKTWLDSHNALTDLNIPLTIVKIEDQSTPSYLKIKRYFRLPGKDKEYTLEIKAGRLKNSYDLNIIAEPSNDEFIEIYVQWVKWSLLNLIKLKPNFEVIDNRYPGSLAMSFYIYKMIFKYI